MRWLILIPILLMPMAVSAQTLCTSDKMCISGPELNAATDAMCRRARASEERLPLVLKDLSDAQTERDVCRGQLIAALDPPEVKKGIPTWIRVGLDVLAVGAGVGLGASLALPAPPEATVGIAVFAGGVLTLRLILEAF